MTDLHHERPADDGRQGARPRPEQPGGQLCHGGARDEGASACPSCGSQMRLWANYHRCRNCGYKESCCF